MKLIFKITYPFLFIALKINNITDLLKKDFNKIHIKPKEPK